MPKPPAGPPPERLLTRSRSPQPAASSSDGPAPRGSVLLALSQRASQRHPQMLVQELRKRMELQA
eukprot:12116789-Alexandrium_andersonii.AAC.1